MPLVVPDFNEYQTRRWIVALVNTNSGGDTILSCYFWPENTYIIPDPSTSTNKYLTISLDAIYDGMLTEYMNIQDNAVIGVWMLPFCPFATGL